MILFPWIKILKKTGDSCHEGRLETEFFQQFLIIDDFDDNNLVSVMVNNRLKSLQQRFVYHPYSYPKYQTWIGIQRGSRTPTFVQSVIDHEKKFVFGRRDRQRENWYKVDILLLPIYDVICDTYRLWLIDVLTFLNFGINRYFCVNSTIKQNRKKE